MVMYAIKKGRQYLGNYGNWTRSLNKAMLFRAKYDAEEYLFPTERIVKVKFTVTEVKK